MRRRVLALALPLAAVVVLAASSPTLAAAPEPRVVAEVDGITGPIIDVALSPDGSTGYVVDQSSRIAIFDTATNQVTGHSIDFSTSFDTPTEVSLASDGKLIVAAGMWIVTLNADGTLADFFGLGSSFDTRALAAVPNGPSAMGTVSATLGAPVRVFRMNLGSHVPTDLSFDTAPAPDFLAGIAVGPGTGDDNDVVVAGASGGVGRVYVFGSPFDPFPAVPPLTVTLTGTTFATAVALSADGTQALVTAPAESRAFLIDVGTGAIDATIDTPVPGFAAAFAPDGATAYVAGGADLVVIDTASGTIAADVALGTTQAAAVTTSPDGNRLWVGDDVPTGDVRMLSASAVTASSATVSGTAGAPLSAAFTASGFGLPVAYSVSPALPAGLALDPATGAVSGTPTAAQAATAYTVTASATDGDSATTTWTLTVAAAATGGGTAGGSGTPSQLAASGTDLPWPLLGAAAAVLTAGTVLTLRRRPQR
jgi:hypothetical protein